MFERLAAANPEPKGELESVNPFTLLVAVVLSAQATDAGVNKATKPLFAVADTPEKMAALGEDGLAERIRTIGLYRSKARHVIALSKALIERYGGEVPRDREALEALPGVGRKTANVVLNTAFGEPTLAVDTHVFRVANRLGMAPGKTPREVEDELMTVVPEALPGPRPSLADPARPLRLQGAQARVLEVCGPGCLSLSAEDAAAFALRVLAVLQGTLASGATQEVLAGPGAWPVRHPGADSSVSRLCGGFSGRAFCGEANRRARRLGSARTAALTGVAPSQPAPRLRRTSQARARIPSFQDLAADFPGGRRPRPAAPSMALTVAS